LVVLVFPSILSIYFDVFSVRKWIGQFDDAERPVPARDATDGSDRPLSDRPVSAGG
jgi:HAE1 family hydrophobic/amphiphilic exporter-1